MNMGKLCFCVDLILQEKLPFIPVFPAYIKLQFITEGEEQVLSAANAITNDSLSLMKFYTGEKGGTIKLFFEIESDPIVNEKDLMLKTERVGLVEFTFYDSDEVNRGLIIEN